LEQLDVDGAIRETAERVNADTRAAFLRKAGVFGGSIVAGGAALGAVPAIAAASPRGDIAILNFALTLEYLEAAFYKQAIRDAGLHGQEYSLATTVARHEAEHVAFLRKALGHKAIKSPKFDFRGTTKDRGKFLATAFALENEGVQAYSGQGPRLTNVAYVKAAISILTIEARHASAFALIVGRVGGSQGITPKGAFDKPKTMKQVLSDVSDLHFIV
jgi:hypothetical protein